MKHTKGEWLIEGNEIVTDDWRMIVKLPDDYRTLTDEDRTNAQLIASAPELLGACKRVVNCKEIVGGMGKAILISYETLSIIEQAIAKAEGKKERR
ncbi:hypothetical protein LCGC14_0398910 [marine sediment metagenome]|uniref:Uncharacterized protein n=1 Tax=marine sediment metagenome TaxID=412755 RepID=A0A0F9SXC2_9ZZZZ